MKNIKKLLFSTITVCMLGIGIFTPMVSAEQLGERVLKPGVTGEDVRELQNMLTKRGFTISENDGIYGDGTKQAVTEFQKQQNLAVDGIAGSATLTVLLGETAFKTSRAADLSGRTKQVFDIVATAYAPGPHDNGKWGNLTHIGTQVRPGIIAVDPRVIPLRSRVYIEFADGSGMYAVAEDTGGAIKGNRIDIAMWTVAEAYQFGMQKVKVYVLS